MNIYDLKPLKEEIRGALIWVEYPNGEMNNLAESFNIEDGTLFLTVEENSAIPFKPLKLGSLFDYLDHERKCDCWDGHKSYGLFEGPNTLYDCDINVYKANTDQVFELEELAIQDGDVIFKAVPLCEEVDTQVSPSSVELVITIDDKLYEIIKNPEKLETMYHAGKLCEAVKNGTLLPKGHGRLIDAKEIRNYLTLADVPTIIEADKVNCNYGCNTCRYKYIESGCVGCAKYKAEEE